jgi:aldose sugar dehydrogenase
MQMLSSYARRYLTSMVLTIVVTAVATTMARQGPPPGGQPGAPAVQKPNPNFPRVAPLPFPDAPQTLETLGPPATTIRVVPFVKGLANPWSLAFLPDGNILVTEKAGRLRIVRGGTLDPEPIAGVPAVFTQGQGGLLEVALHPQFDRNKWIYLTYSKPGDRGATTALARGTFDGKALTDVEDLFVADNWAPGGIHFGSKLAWSRDGLLFMSVGERNDRKRAQDLSLHGGKILRLKDDGTAPADNPFVGKPDVKPEIYSYGHRNVQGLAVHPDTGEVWANEHGPQGGDELNKILPGKNYGWPIATYGREYSGELISSPVAEGVEQPIVFWSPSPGLSGLVIYSGDRFAAWKGNIFSGALAGQYINRVVFNQRGVWGRENLLGALRLRIRDLRQGPDGLLYVAVDGNAAGLLRIEPATATPTANGR